jgi:hypothetical protein
MATRRDWSVAIQKAVVTMGVTCACILACIYCVSYIPSSLQSVCTEATTTMQLTDYDIYDAWQSKRRCMHACMHACMQEDLGRQARMHTTQHNTTQHNTTQP